MLHQFIAARMTDGVEVVDVGAVGRDLRHHDILDLVQPGIIDLGGLLARLRPRGEMRQLGRQDRRLHAVKPAVDPLDLVLMLHQSAMARQHGHVLGECCIAGDDGAGISHRTEILAGIKGIGRDRAEGADLLALVTRQMRLRAVLDHPQFVLVRDRHDLVHIRWLAVEMHRNDADRAWRDRCLDRLGIDGEGHPVGVAEHRRGTGMGDHCRGGDPGMRGGDDFVARLYLQRSHRKIKRIGAVGAGDAVFGVDGACEFSLESVDIGPPDKSVVADHVGDRAVDLALDVLVLELQVCERHRHRSSLYFASLSRRAGFPAYAPAVMMSLVTTEPAPMTTSSAMRTGMIVAFDPIETRLPITVSRQSSFCPRAGPPLAKVSLMNITPWPTKQSSPMVTSSQMKACDCTRERAPTTTPFWISVKGPTKQSSPI